MRTQTRLGTPPSNTTQSPQHPRQTKHADPAHPRGDQRRETIKDHGQVVEDVRGEAVAFAFGFQGCAGAVGEEDCCDAAGGVLENVEEEGGCWGCGWVADSDAFFISISFSFI